MNRDLTRGNISKGLIAFAFPMIVGNLLQQFYNITDTLIVGHAIGKNALAAVGTAYALMTFLTSIFIGLAMGSGSLFSIYYGKRDFDSLKTAIFQSFLLIFSITLVLNILVYAAIDPILRFLSTPEEIYKDIRLYLLIIFSGLIASSMYNYLSSILRSLGNSLIPLYFLGLAALLNVVLDILFVVVFAWGIGGAAIATIIAQYFSGFGIFIYFIRKEKDFLPNKENLYVDTMIMKKIWNISILTGLQQSTMNFGILMVQRLVNSFGPITMAAFAAAVKIDSFAYLPVQDFGNAFSTFIAQNFGAKKIDRIREGIKSAVIISSLFSLIISLLVVLNAESLMKIFISGKESGVIESGANYLRLEGAFYIGIACLFLLYGFYRAVNRPAVSLILTIISLGLRVALAYLLAPIMGEKGIWISIPIGWFIADAVGFVYYYKNKSKLILNDII